MPRLSAARLFGIDGPYARFLLVSLYAHAALLATLWVGAPARPPSPPGAAPAPMAAPSCDQRALPPAELPFRQGIHLVIGSLGGDGPPVIDLLCRGSPAVADLDVVLSEVQGVSLPVTRPARLRPASGKGAAD